MCRDENCGILLECRKKTLEAKSKLDVFLVGVNAELKMVPPNQDDPRRRKPDISRAQKELNWSPVVSSAQSLAFLVR